MNETETLAGIDRATLLAEIAAVRDRCDDYVTDKPYLRCGLDLAASWLDVLLARNGSKA